MQESSEPPGGESHRENWDRLRDASPEIEEDLPSGKIDVPSETPSVVLLFGSAWGDLVTVLGVCTASLLTLAVLGYGAGWAAVPWAIAVGAVWWAVSAAVMLVVRNGTPGMLMAGIAFESQVPRQRAPWTVITALVTWCTLGLPSLLGAERSPLRLVAGVGLVDLSSSDDMNLV